MKPRRAYLAVVAGACLLSIGVRPVPADALRAAVLDTIQSVIDHLPDAGQPAPQVLLDDVVVLGGEWNDTIYVRDRTGATLVKLEARADDPRPRFQRGDRLRIRGHLHPALLVNGVRAAEVVQLPPGPPPEPRPVTAAMLASGEAYQDLVAFECIGRAVRRATDGFQELFVAMGDDTFPVRIELNPTAEQLERFVDAEMRVVGRAAGEVNDRRQFISPRVVVDNLADIETVREAQAPFTAETVGFATIYPMQRDGHRRRISGVAAAGYVGGGLFLSDRTRGLYVAPADPADAAFKDVRPGDQVDAEGFPAMGAFTAYLADARIRVTGTEAIPAPRALGAPVAGVLACDAERVDVSLNITGREDRPGQTEFRGRDGRLTFRCFVTGTAPEAAIPGAMVTVCGVGRVTDTTRDNNRTLPATYELHAAAGDVAVTRHAPLWKQSRLVRALGWTATLLGGLGLAAGVWIVALRGQVRRQLATIEQALHDDAVVEERQRIAREFHDSLEQDLAGLALRLDAAAGCMADAEARDVLDRQRELVARLQEETRMFVWDLRDPRFAEAGFCETLAAQLESKAAATATPIHLHVGGDPPPLPLTVRHHVLRIVGEAVSNAVRHAAATSITVRVSADGREITIEDDGRGFDLAACRAKRGHFGIRGMEERGRRVGAAVEIESAAAGGTRVIIRLADEPARAAAENPKTLA